MPSSSGRRAAPVSAPLAPPAERVAAAPAPAPAEPVATTSLDKPDTRIVDRDGNLLAANALFRDEGYGRSVSAVRMYEDYLPTGGRTRLRRLLFAEDVIVDRDTADAVRRSVEANTPSTGVPAAVVDAIVEQAADDAAPTPVASTQ